MNALEAFYETLRKNVRDGALNLIPGALNSDPIANFYQTFIQNGQFSVGGVTIDFPPPRDTITVRGSSDSLGIPGLAITFVFALGQDQQTLVSSLTAEGPGVRWNFDNVPWFALRDPSISLRADDGLSQAVGTVSSVIDLADTPLAVAVQVPGPQNQLTLTGTFLANPPSIDRVFQLVGGINLAALLPPPLNVAADLSLRQVSVAYSLDSGSINFMSVEVGTTREWPLFGNVKLSGITIQLFVMNPGDLASRSVSYQVTGTFGVGEGTIEVGATYPDLAVTGAMAPDSKSIPLSEFITMFVPGTDIDLAADLTSFSMYVQPAGKTTYSVGVGLDTDWGISVGGTEIFKITNLDFQVAGVGSDVTGSIAGTTVLGPEDSAITVAVKAGYQGQEQGWVFEARQVRGEIELNKLIQKYLLPEWKTDDKYTIDRLGLMLEPRTSSYTITGRTMESWQTPLGQADLTAEMTLSHTREGYSGELKAEIEWYFIDLLLSYNFDPKSKCFSITWEGLTGKIEEKIIDNQKHQIASLSLSGVTLGGMIEKFVSWATGQRYGLAAPWNLLNEISLDALALSFDFTTRQVSFSYDLGGLDLGFARFDKIGLAYVPTGENKGVNVEITGRFSWQTGDKLSWDATRPETTPAPPGGGNKYLDMRLLALGQHVGIGGYQTFTSVKEAISAMRGLKVPQPGQIPVNPGQPQPGQPYYNPANSWLIAADFGVLKVEKQPSATVVDLPQVEQQGHPALAALRQPAATLMTAEPPAAPAEDDAPQYFLQLSVIFNDPNLYAARLALAGPAAKIFAGLEFEIMYRRISDTVGVYQSELKLPDAMRELTIGAYSITLPVFGIAIYTNGDFKLDVGFPWNQDFSRSFTVQGIVYPGIPLLGSGGFYFGKLSSATSDQVPRATNGQFNPVIIFGLGLQVGVGKYIEKGILRAGFSITVLGIIEGVLARWNPNDPSQTGGSSRNQLQGDYYFWLQGTVGIAGKLYGSVDFSVVKADVNVEVKLLAQITFESYAPIPISVIASVDISLSLSINLGLFKVKLHLSFSARIKETFTIENHGTPPWKVADPPNRLSLRTRQRRRLRALRQPHLRLSAPAVPPVMDWSNLKPAATPASLTGYLTPVLTVTGDAARSLAQQQPAYVALLLLESMDPSAAQSRPAGAADTSFELLSKQVFRWVVAAAQPGPLSADQVNALVISDDQLQALMNYLSSPENPVPVPVEAINQFMAGQFRLGLQVPSGQGTADTTFFPMVPDLELEVPSYNGSQPLKYQFSQFNALGDTYLKVLRAYFDELAVQVEDEMTRQERLKARGADLSRFSDTDGPSMATFVYGDYFLLLARQMVQGARDALRNFKYPIPAGQTVQQMVDWVNRTGNLSGDTAYTVAELFEANADHLLNPGKTLRITGIHYQASNTDTLNQIADTYMRAFSAAELAAANANAPEILTPGATVKYPNRPDYRVAPGDTLSSIAQFYSVDLNRLVAESNVASLQGLLLPLALLSIPPIPHITAQSGTDTLAAIARHYGIPVAGLADSPDNARIIDLFATAADAYLNLPHLPQFQVGELIAEVQRTLGIQHLSGMAARYFLHGLRLPTAGIVPKQPCMCSQGGPALAPECGLYALTGQQFPIPALDDQNPFRFYLNIPDGLSWVTLVDGGGKQ